MKSVWTQPSLSRDFILLSAVILFIAAITCVWIVRETQHSHSARIADTLQNESLRIDRTLIIEVDSAAYLLESLGRQIIHSSTEDYAVIAGLLKSFDVNPKTYSMFGWISKDQRIHVTNHAGVLQTSIDVADRDYLKKSLTDPWKVQIGRPIEGRISEKWIIPLAMGLTDKQDRYIGTVMVSVDIENLTDLFRHVIHTPNINFAVYSKTLVPLSELITTDSEDLMRYVSDTKLTSAIHAGERKGMISKASIFNERSMHMYFELSDTYPYVLLVGYDRSAYIYEFYRLLVPRLLQAIGVALFLIGMLWMLRQRMIQPVMALAVAAGKIARGERELQLPVSGLTEIDQMALALAHIQNRIAEQERTHENLQQKLQETFTSGTESKTSAKLYALYAALLTKSLITPSQASVPALADTEERQPANLTAAMHQVEAVLHALAKRCRVDILLEQFPETHELRTNWTVFLPALVLCLAYAVFSAASRSSLHCIFATHPESGGHIAIRYMGGDSGQPNILPPHLARMLWPTAKDAFERLGIRADIHERSGVAYEIELILPKE